MNLDQSPQKGSWLPKRPLGGYDSTTRAAFFLCFFRDPEKFFSLDFVWLWLFFFPVVVGISIFSTASAREFSLIISPA